LPVAVDGAGRTAVQRVAKRSIDIAGAIVGLLIGVPIMLAAAVAILIIDGRPVMFRQFRAGAHGEPFVIFKFRTMRRDADAERDGLRAANEVAGGASFKMTNDPRVTRLGAWLRRTSIDELPQLLNVLLGEMSLVGPRPHPFDDVAGYQPWQFRRLSVKPGLTGLWQIEGRAETEFDRWVEKDLQYIDAWSLLTDLEIIVRTIPAILKRTGR
jgi:lipopolysaccharide/colanic/teichoic acid biosynthesis glycosyltransferase